MEYTLDNTGTEVEVTTTRTIRVGQLLKINPSEAYLGVDSGNVRVLAIVPSKPDNETVYAEGIDTEGIIRDIEEYKDIHLDTLGGPGSTDYEDELMRLDNQPWVVYHYPYAKQEEVYIYVFPLEEFVQHSMMY